MPMVQWAVLLILWIAQLQNKILLLQNSTLVVAMKMAIAGIPDMPALLEILAVLTLAQATSTRT